MEINKTDDEACYKPVGTMRFIATVNIIEKYRI